MLIALPGWWHTIPDAVKVPLTALLGILAGAIGERFKTSIPRSRERKRLYSLLADAYALAWFVSAQNRKMVDNRHKDEPGVTFRLLISNIARFRRLLRQKRYAEFLKRENFKNLEMDELVAAKEISDCLSSEESVADGYEAGSRFVNQCMEVVHYQIRLNRLDFQRFTRNFEKQKASLVEELFGDRKAELEKMLRLTGRTQGEIEEVLDLIDRGKIAEVGKILDREL